MLDLLYFLMWLDVIWNRSSYEVTYIVNFTDVDDKMIRKAEQMAVSVPELAETIYRGILRRYLNR